MPKSPFPLRIDPHHCAEEGRRWEGELPLERFPRLKRLALGARGPVRFRITFAREDHRKVARGEVAARLLLTCQRCLEPVEIELRRPIAVGIVSSLAEAERLPETLEPVVVKEGEEIPFTEILEEELLLALPPFPKHSSCRLEGEEEREVRESPFAILKQLQVKKE